MRDDSVMNSTGGVEIPARYPNFEQTRVQEFWLALQNEELKTTKCRGCGTIVFPPRSICSKCYSDDVEWVALPKKGKLYSYCGCEQHSYTPLYAVDEPFLLGVVELENGIRLLSYLVDAKYEDLRVGDPVEIVFRELNWIGLKKHRYFVIRPAE